MTDTMTPTLRIKRELDGKLERIRSNGDLSQEAKRRYIVPRPTRTHRSATGRSSPSRSAGKPRSGRAWRSGS